MISIVDYGMGNIGSLQNMIRRVGGSSCLAGDPESVRAAKKLLLPGIGDFDNAVRRLREKDLWSAIDDKVRNEKVPALCICLGAQLVTEGSEEGHESGFGWILGRTIRFRFDPEIKLRVPHMGWNDISQRKSSRLFRELPDDPCFYFVHSYHMVADRAEDTLATTNYGYDFASALERDNVYALQFHPEKSHKYGMAVLKNFWEL